MWNSIALSEIKMGDSRIQLLHSYLRPIPLMGRGTERRKRSHLDRRKNFVYLSFFCPGSSSHLLIMNQIPRPMKTWCEGQVNKSFAGYIHSVVSLYADKPAGH